MKYAEAAAYQAAARPHPVGKVEEDGSFRVKGGKVFDPDTRTLRKIHKPPKKLRYQTKARQGLKAETRAAQAAARPVVKTEHNPLAGFLSRGARAIAGVEHKHNVKMSQELKARRDRGGSTTPIGDAIGHFFGNAARQAKTVYNAIDDYGDDRWNDLRNPRHGRWGNRQNVPYTESDMYNSMEVSPGLISKIIQIGEAAIRTRGMSGLSGREQINDMFAGINHLPRMRDVSSQIPREKSLGVGQEFLLHRKPFLTEHNPRGRIVAGGIGDEHAEIYPLIKGHSWPESANKWHQGHVSAPLDDLLKIDLGFGKVWGITPPPNQAPTMRLLQYILRNYKDSDIHIGSGVSPFRPPKGMSDHAYQRLMDAIQGMER